jgi:hypothetical protein
VRQRYPLDAAQIAAAEETIALTRQRGQLLAAKESLVERRGDARSRALAVVVGEGFAFATRLKASVALVSPTIARRALVDRSGPATVAQRFGADSELVVG